MRRRGAITEAEAILAFLRGEASSPRFRAKMAPSLAAFGADWSLIEAGDPANDDEAALRRRLLWHYRGPDGPAPLLDGFPDDVRWQRVDMSSDELLDARYMRYPYWDELSGGTRSPRVGAKNIRAGVQPVPGPATTVFLEFARAVAAGAVVRPPFLVAEREEGPFVVLEGHARVTAIALAATSRRGGLPGGVETRGPAAVGAILGVSGRMAEWAMF